ncbi:hypothetical protein Tco_0130808 [Tanacetum coccineum]
MAECTATYEESGTRCNGCVFDGIPLLSFDEAGKANYRALRKVSQDGGASEAIQDLRDATDDVRGQNHRAIMQRNAMRFGYNVDGEIVEEL